MLRTQADVAGIIAEMERKIRLIAAIAFPDPAADINLDVTPPPYWLREDGR